MSKRPGYGVSGKLKPNGALGLHGAEGVLLVTRIILRPMRREQLFPLLPHAKIAPGVKCFKGGCN